MMMARGVYYGFWVLGFGWAAADCELAPAASAAGVMWERGNVDGGVHEGGVHEFFVLPKHRVPALRKQAWNLKPVPSKVIGLRRDRPPLALSNSRGSIPGIRLRVLPSRNPIPGTASTEANLPEFSGCQTTTEYPYYHV